jgi:WD40 repeat protein
MRRRRRLIAVICLGLIACACAGVWLLPPRAVRFPGHTDFVQRVSASADGRTLASSSTDGTIRLWDVATRKGRATLSGPDTHPAEWTVVFSPDGKTLAITGDTSGEIRLWDVAGGRELASLVGHRGSVKCLAFSSDGGTLASGGDDGTLRLWDVAGHGGRTLRDDARPVRCVAFCCDGEALATVADSASEIELWDAAGGKPRATLQGPGRDPVYLAASPDGRTLASADLGGGMKLWDAATGKEKSLETPQLGDANGYLGFSPDGKTLAAINSSNWVEFWDVASGKSTGICQGDGCPPRPGRDAAIRTLLAIHWQLAEIYGGMTEGESVFADSVLFAPGGKVFALGRDVHNYSVVKMWEIHPVPRGE